MAMKFWFGKKDAEQEARESAPRDVQSTPEGVEKDGVSLSIPAPPVVVPQEAQKGDAFKGSPSQPVISSEAGHQAPAPSVVAAGGAPQGGAPAPVPVVPAAMPAPAEGAPGVAPAAGPAAPGAAAKPVLKAVGGPVRLTARPAGEGGGAAPQAAAGHPAFGLRARPEAETAAEEKGVVTRDLGSTLARPKTDQKALYYQLMNGLYDAVLILDDEGHIVDCSSRASEMLGYSREETWDMPIDKVITGMTAQMFDHLKRNLAEHHHILIDARCTRQDGTSFAVEVGVSTISLTCTDNLVFTMRNVERRKNALDEMRKGHAALEIALAPAFVCDKDGFFVVVNKAFLDSFGIPDEAQAKGVRFMDLLPDAARLFLRASSGEKLRETLSVPTPDGHEIKLKLALAPLQSGQTITGVAGSILQM